MPPSFSYHFPYIHCEDQGGNGHVRSSPSIVSLFYASASHTDTEMVPQKQRHAVTGIAAHALFRGGEQSEHFQ